ncbi:MAG: trigger factor [Oscillospiraceae bacterium]
MIVKSVEKKEHNGVTFQVEVDAEAFETAIGGAYLKNKKSITVPGFRKGKAPRMVIEGMYGENVFYDDAIEAITPDAFGFAAEQEKLNTVGQPTVTNVEISDEKLVTLSFEAALYPEVTLGEYKGLKAERADATVTDADIADYIEDIRKRNGRQVSVERAAALGDTAVIDFDGYLDGERFEGGKAEGHSLELGSGQFVPGFEEQVVGMSVGDEKEIGLTFPEDYHEGLAGKAVVFKVKLHEVLETQLPEVDDELAKDASEFDTLAEFKIAIREEMEKKRSAEVEKEFAQRIMLQAVENMTCDVPEVMIEERVETIMGDYDRNLMQQGMRLEEYLRMMGMDPSSFRATVMPEAKKQVELELMLDAIVAAENIGITPEEIEEAFNNAATDFNLSIDVIKQAIPIESVERDVKMKKAAAILRDTAVAVEKTEPAAE